MRQRAYLLLALVCLAVLVYLLARPQRSFQTQAQAQPAAQAAVPHRREQSATSSAEPAPREQASALAAIVDPGSFNRRLRCTQYRSLYGSRVSPQVLSLLCERRPLEAVKILI